MSRQENIKEYQRLGIKHVKQLKSYYLHGSINLRSEDRGYGYEIVFVGHAEKDARIQYIRDLLEAGLPLKLFGEERYQAIFARALYRRLARLRYSIPIIEKWGQKSGFFSGRNRDQYTRRVRFRRAGAF